MTKLTDAQIVFLRRINRSPVRVMRGYKPAEKLVALGMAEVTVVRGALPWSVDATHHGRAALARSQEKRNADPA